MLKLITAGTSGLLRGARRVRVRAATTAGAAVLLGLGAFAALGTSTTSGATSRAAAAAGSGGTVTIRAVDDLDTFNPAKTGAPNLAVQALELTYDRLVYLSPSGKLEPYLATSWTTTPSSVTLKIRKGATCADGTAVTPAVVAGSLNYELAKSTASPYLNYDLGPAALKSITSNSAADTVTIALTKPYNALVTALATAFPDSIICPAGVKNPKTLSAAPDGSGPYTLDVSKTTRGSVYTFTLRKNYNWGPNGWSATKPGVAKTIVYRVVTDETTAANLLSTGQVDIAPVFGINEQRTAANHSAYTFTTSALQMGSWGSVFNQTAGRVGADSAVRHAVYLALDAPSMVKAAFSNEGVVFKTMVTPNMQCYDTAVGNVTPGFNPAAARSILEKDGYKPGAGGVMTKNGKPLSLHIVMWNTTNQLGDYMQQELAQIGVSSTVQNTDINTWLSALFTTKNYDLTVYSYYSSFPNPVIMPAQDASLSINDPKYFALSNTAEEAPAAKQCPAWDKALEQAVTNYDVKPMGVSKNIWFGRGWTFAAPYDVVVDPFTLVKSK
jgi:peptide/nickel transport system substrate-binding protein